MKELRHPVVGFEGLYEVSDQGNVRSVPHKAWHTRGKGFWLNKPGKVLKQHPTGGVGYLGVSLHKDGKQKTYNVHSLVATAFLGPVPDGQEVRHGPEGILCNVLSNLSYGTRSQNMMDKVRDGKDSRGRKNKKWTGVTEDAVLAIYNEPSYYGYRKKLMAEFDVTESMVKDIRLGRSWSWLTGAE